MAKVLLPVDLQHESSWTKALPVAVAQARLLDGKVWLMTVVPHLASGLDWRYAVRGEKKGSLDYDIKEIVKEAEHRLRQLRDEHIPPEFAGDVIGRHGTIYQEIVETAEELPADLIVMTSHRPTLKDYLLGPNAARVVRHAKSSVHIVRD
ncbi:universal stress protein [Inquilinus sp. CAU 1745]|uniref:universal stress protein n=1 Tax=Inquilinus sp. CAU 1745 TaxID=3140369 RepID=UPI00325AAF20